MNKFLSLFVPHEKNNHRALLLKPSFLCLLIAFYIFNQSLIKSFVKIKPGVLGYSSEITASKVFALTNIERQNIGLPPLHYSSKLSESAREKAQDMFANNYWAHNSPTGVTPWDFFKKVDYTYSIAGENLAKDFYDTDSLMTAWMKSPTHKANIVNNKYQEIGIGVVNGILDGVKTTLVVQHFGSPLNGLISDQTIDEKEFNSDPYKIDSLSKNVLSQSVYSKNINPLILNKIIGLVMFILIIGVLFIDGFVTIKNKTKRLTGSSVGHIGFLVIILFFMILTQQGTIF